ncbi:L,D-transpeptidase family protein [Thaumasiovibrio sp. DFM-14]|uniref:L,D-transpeptidase family protein n=1 Tax=Thaumasiovibrio sp. DFM-14 TaxID=3384792 RepID=UPI0039A34D73
MSKRGAFGVCLLLLSLTPQMAHPAAIDALVINKEQRQLLVMAGELTLKVIPIRLGFDPIGHKRWRGDGRTPEGNYYIRSKNAGSQFYLSLELNYPNDKDLRFAEKFELDPGDNIFLHGHPIERRQTTNQYLSSDWTEGCVAMADEDIVFLFHNVEIGTKVIIQP